MLAWLGAKWAASKMLAARVPWQVWAVIGLAIAIALGVWWHSGKVKAYGAERFAAGAASRDAEIRKLQGQLEVDGRKLAEKLRSENNAKNAAVTRSAAAVLVRGPGKAACAPVAPAAPDRHQPDRQANAPVPQVPAGTGEPLIGMPFAGAVAFATQNDQCLIDRDSWNEWYAKYSAVIADYQRRAAAVNAGGNNAPPRR